MSPAYSMTQTIVWPQGAHLTVNALIKVRGWHTLPQ